MDSWQQLLCLTIALALSTLVGVERQMSQKSAGLRTHALVGVGAALFMVVSKYGFYDVEEAGLVTLDPSRMAAQIVSGIGFVGAGLVFVKRNKVRGLTTAASIWLVAAIGSSAGAGLVVPAAFVTLVHFLVVLGYPYIVRKTHMGPSRDHTVHVQYEDGTGALRRILFACTSEGLVVHGFEMHQALDPEEPPGVLDRMAPLNDALPAERNLVEIELELEGNASPPRLVQALSALNGIKSVRVDDFTD
ncbi:MgtC/SapB family protein [Sinomonas atrocyanea]|nr:MgtC/SapB family protein [Sinomonas atrocyanea]